MIELLQQLDLERQVGHFVMVLFRTTGLFFFLPFLGSEMIPLRIRGSAAIVLAIVFAPLVARLEVPPVDMAGWAVLGVRELAAGFALGAAARVVFGGIEAAAHLVSGQSGFSLAAMVDPASGDQNVAPGIFMNLLATAVFLAADLHHLFIRAFHASYELLPPAASLPAVGGLDQAVATLGMRLFTVAVELAAPALLITITLDLVMVLVGKAMPQVPILIVGYPVKMAVGLLSISVLAVTVGRAMGWIGRTLASDGAAVLAALGGR